MAKRVLTIGVGGSGKAGITFLKERLEETYGQVPPNVVLLSLDTDDLRETDTFAGTRLTSAVDDRGREAEYQAIISPTGMTMNTIFADIVSGRTASYMQWLEKDKLDRMLSPTERDIRGGAQQRRPVGRTALFLRWAVIYQAIINSITRMYGDEEALRVVEPAAVEKNKRQIFLIGSLAGGTGSGFFIDVANLIRHAVQSNPTWQSVDVTGIIVLPDAFNTYTTIMEDPTNLQPNSYAALRELDRFMRSHNASTPYLVRYSNDPSSITWSTNQPLDHVYLVDTAGRGSSGDLDLSGNPLTGVFPIIADFVMAHIDQSMGDVLATLRSNAGQHASKTEGWMYNGFNVQTYIFPVDDVIESFSYRFVREVLDRQYLAITDKRLNTELQAAADEEIEQRFTDTDIAGHANPVIIQKAVAATRRVNGERPDSSWRGLLSLISLSESTFAQDYQTIEQSMEYLRGSLIASKEGEYRHEGYDEGYVRLINFSDHFQIEYMGQLSDPDNEASRVGGGWDSVLGRYPDALRQRWAETLDAVLLEVLNRRDQKKLLLPYQLPYAQLLVASVRQRLERFRDRLEQDYRELQVEARIRNCSEQVRQAISRMHETKDQRPLISFGRSEARKAQDAYIQAFTDLMDLRLHQRVYQTVVTILDGLGAAERDAQGPSVLEQANRELEVWQITFTEVDRRLSSWAKTHEQSRKDKEAIRVRRYLTDPQFEHELYRDPECSEAVRQQVLGQIAETTGMVWQRTDPGVALRHQLLTVWTKEAKGPEEIARQFLIGMKGLFQVVRNKVTIGDRLATKFTSPAAFVGAVNQINEPFLRYNQSTNGKPMSNERYVSFNREHTGLAAQSFLDAARTTLGNQGLQVDSSSESLVACTVVEIARGAKLSAIDQFEGCASKYLGKLSAGRETLHLFTEEQIATGFEGRIDRLGDPTNKWRLLDPELVMVMGDNAKLRAFTLACAYGLIKEGIFTDLNEGTQTSEVILSLNWGEATRKLPLSNSAQLPNVDSSFKGASSQDQSYRLYFNALQNFVLIATEKPGVPTDLVATLIVQLRRMGVNTGHIENPFTLRLREVNEAILRTRETLAGSNADPVANARHSIDYLKTYRKDKVREGFEKSPTQRIKDLGTVMDLIIGEEINNLERITQS